MPDKIIQILKSLLQYHKLIFQQIGKKRAEEYGFSTIQELYDYFVNDIVHNEMVDELRIEFLKQKSSLFPQVGHQLT